MSFLDTVFNRFGYQKKAAAPVFEKAEKREAFAQNPLSMAYQSINNEFGIKRPSQITMQTLRRMSRANWVDRACIETLRDEVTSVPWDILPLDPKKPFNPGFQKFLKYLLDHPNRNKENWRTLIQKVVEDILVLDAGVIEKVRNGKGQIVELYHTDGSTIRQCFDVHGMAGNPAYEQYLLDKMGLLSKEPVAQWNNDDMIYIIWNPQGAVDTFGYGMSPVEAGLAVGTAFLYAEAYNMGFFRQNTIPPVIINMGKDVPPGEVDKFRSFLASEMMGTDGFHKPILGSFNEGFEIKELLKNPGDMAWEKYVEWQMKWKVALYRMSPQDIGFNVDMYKMEGEVQMQLSKNKAIESLKGVLQEYINREILADDGFGDLGENLGFNWIDEDVLDPLDQANVDKINVTSAIQTVNEIRKRQGLDPVEGGDVPVFLAGNQVIPLNAVGTITQLNAVTQLQQAKPQPQPEQLSTDDDDATEKSVKKNFSPEEGCIVSLADNLTCVTWMDDRGVTQPLFVTDYGKTKGITIKPSFLDDKKAQEPPEQKVAEMLRLLQVNTPEVKIMHEDEVVKLLPTNLYPEWTKYLSLEAPYDSQEWRQRWGDTRKSAYYIVTGYVNARDLGNADLQKEMAASPDSYTTAVQDLARVWLAEMRFKLGDRKPGHYLISQDGNGFGVDYQFYQDEFSWEKSRHFLPRTLANIDYVLYDEFVKAVRAEAKDFGNIVKAFSRPAPADWTRESQLNDIERELAELFQRKLLSWYMKVVRVRNGAKKLITKADDFNPDDSYITNGDYVYQNGKKYPISVLGGRAVPNVSDLAPTPADYRDAFDFGANKVKLAIEAQFPDITVRNAQLYAPMFENRANLLAGSVSSTLKDAIDNIIVNGIDNGLTYGEIADQIKNALSVDPNNPDMPGWRAQRIARTESMWAINEGMRQQYKDAGIKKINITPAGSACDKCIDAASGNPYDVGDEDVLPIHPSCRCVWTADWSELL